MEPRRNRNQNGNRAAGEADARAPAAAPWLTLALAVMIVALGLRAAIWLNRAPAFASVPVPGTSSGSGVLKCYQCIRKEPAPGNKTRDCDVELGEVVECRKKADGDPELSCALSADDTGKHSQARPGSVYVRGCGERPHDPLSWATGPPPPCQILQGWNACFCSTDFCNSTPDDVLACRISRPGPETRYKDKSAADIEIVPAKILIKTAKD